MVGDVEEAELPTLLARFWLGGSTSQFLGGEVALLPPPSDLARPRAYLSRTPRSRVRTQYQAHPVRDCPPPRP